MSYIVAKFHTFNFSSDEIIAISGEIEYPYIKLRKLTNYSSLQLAAKESGRMRISARFASSSRYLTLYDYAGNRTQGVFYWRDQQVGTYLIERINRTIDSLDRNTATIDFRQINLFPPVDKLFEALKPIGAIGLLQIDKSELLSAIKERSNFPLSMLERLHNTPKIQPETDDLAALSFDLRFSKTDNAQYIERFNGLWHTAVSNALQTVIIKGVQYGDYVVANLQWMIPHLGAIDASIELIASPLGLPKKPIIVSFVVNSVQRVDELAPALTSLTYQDPITGGSSVLEVEFDERMPGLPVEGDSIEIKIAYHGSESNLINTGTHKCDYPQRRYSPNSPNTITVGATSYDYNLSLASQEEIVYTNRNLNSIVNEIANRFNLTVIGNVTTNAIAGTSSQSFGDVEFKANSYIEVLKRLSEQFGYRLKLKLGNIYFESYASLENFSTVAVLTQFDCISAEFTQRLKDIYRLAYAAHRGSSTTASAIDNNAPVANYLDLRQEGWYADLNTAIRRSSGALRKTNRRRHTGTIITEGDYRFIAGVNIQLLTFDDAKDNGKFQIEKATHRLSAVGGWTSELELVKVF